MKQTEKGNKEIKNMSEKEKTSAERNVQPRETMEDVQKLVQLLQIHQIELEQQNQELRIAHGELEESRNKYVNLFDFSPVPYFTLDSDGIIKEVNLRASSMLGRDRRKLIDRHFQSFIPAKDRDIYYSFMKNVFASEVKQTCELEVLSRNKQTFHVLLEALKLDNMLEEKTQCQVALIDLTEYKKIEDSLRKANVELKSVNDTKDKFFSIIAHDLRSPFQSLLMTSEIFTAEIETLSREEIVQFSKGLYKNLTNLLDLLENLLNWSLMQRNMLEYKPQMINLNETVDNVVEILIPNALQKKISISNRIDCSTMAYADPQMLRSAIHNLSINAIKFTRSGGEIVFSSIEKNSFVEISIKDSGIGMTLDKSTNLFDFNSVSSTNKGTEGEIGSGLGLNLCKEFIERNNGRIWVESELGKGSKFTFSIPKEKL